MFELLNKSNSKNIKTIKQNAFQYASILQTKFITNKQSKLLVEVLTYLESSYDNYTENLMLKYALNKLFLYKLFNFNQNIIKQIDTSVKDK